MLMSSFSFGLKHLFFSNFGHMKLKFVNLPYKQQLI